MEKKNNENECINIYNIHIYINIYTTNTETNTHTMYLWKQMSLITNFTVCPNYTKQKLCTIIENVVL